MEFLQPSGLRALWLLVPVLLLFLVRRRPRQAVVSTLAFFKGLAQAYREAPWLRRLKRLLALLLAAATVGTLGLALAHAVASPGPDEWRSVVVVVDVSASMGMRDEEGRTRVEVARETLRRRVESLGAGVAAMLVTHGRRAEILLPSSRDRRALARALEGIEPRPVEGDAREALHLAGRLAALEAPAAIWHVTDDPLPEHDVAATEVEGEAPAQAVPLAERLGLAPGVTLETIDVSLPGAVNAGISALALRRRPLEHAAFDAFVEVVARGAGEVEARLLVERDGAEIALRRLTLAPGAPARLVLPLEAASGAALVFSLQVEGDRLAADDVAYARVPDVRPLRVLWVRPDPDPYTQLALMALAEKDVVEAFEIAPADWPPPPEPAFDVVLFDRWLPSPWPEGTPALVLEPPGSEGPVHAVPLEGDGLPVEGLRAVDDEHPLLYGVASDRLGLAQTAVIEAQGSLVPIWTGPMGPLLVAGDVKGQRVAIGSFSPRLSTRLTLLPSFPLLLGNALLWLAEGEHEDPLCVNLRAGEALELQAASIVWSRPGVGEEHVDVEGRRVVALERLGFFEAGKQRGSASLLSRHESAGTAAAAARAPGVAAPGTEARGDLRPACLWIALLLLLAEAWLFHRWSVH